MKNVIRTRSGEARRLHLSHDYGTIDFNRAVTDREIVCNDLVRLPAIGPSSLALTDGQSGRSIQNLDPLRISRRDPVMHVERGSCGTKQSAAVAEACQ